MLKPIDVQLQLKRIHCFDNSNAIGRAEPYLWVVFFRIDGKSTFLDDKFVLQGTVTEAFTNVGDRGNLGVNDVNAGDDIPIPPQYEYNTTLIPISLKTPLAETTNLGGIIGCLVILLEADNTLYSTAADSHRALLRDIQTVLNNLISDRTFICSSLIREVDSFKKKVALAMTDTLQWSTAGNMDDKIGSAVFNYSHEDLLDENVTDIAFSKRWKNKGDWEITGCIHFGLTECEDLSVEGSVSSPI